MCALLQDIDLMDENAEVPFTAAAAAATHKWRRSKTSAVMVAGGTGELGFYYPHFPSAGHLTRAPPANSHDRPQYGGHVIKNRKLMLVTDRFTLDPACWRKPRVTVHQPRPTVVVFRTDGVYGCNAAMEEVQVELVAASAPGLHIKPGCNLVAVHACGRVHINLGAVNGASPRNTTAIFQVQHLVNGQPQLLLPLSLELQLQAKQTTYHLKGERRPRAGKRSTNCSQAPIRSPCIQQLQQQQSPAMEQRLPSALPAAPGPGPDFDHQEGLVWKDAGWLAVTLLELHELEAALDLGLFDDTLTQPAALDPLCISFGL